MIRTTFAALCLAALPIFVSQTAIAGDQSKGAHTHIGSHVVDGASFRSPINYRPLGKTSFVRTKAYDEADTKDYRVAQGLIYYKERSPLLETARANNPTWRSVVSVEEFDN